MSSDDFETVTRNPQPQDMFISVSAYGAWYLPNRVHDEYFGTHDHARVAVDQADRRVALVPAEGPEGEDVYYLEDVRGSGRRFTCKPALTQLGVDLDETIRLEPEWDDEMGAVIVDLADECQDQE